MIGARARWLFAVLALCACSTLGLDEFDVAPCKPGRACAELDRALPPDRCERYYCTASGQGCELGPKDADRDGHADAELCEGAAAAELDCDDGNDERSFAHEETCDDIDAIDNDCDGFIDEGVDLHAEEIGALALGGPVQAVAHAAPTPDALYFLLSQPDAEGIHGVTRARLLARELEALDEQPQSEWCEGPPSAEQCDLGQLAIGGTANALLAAAVHRSGCASGQLRVGACSAAGFDLSLAAFDGETARAVEVDPELGCTRSEDGCGASQPAVAVLAAEGTAPQALVAWLAPVQSAECEDACGCMAQSFAVMGLALLVRDQGAEPKLALLGQGRPIRLGEQSVDAPPALAALNGSAGSGYVLAYPAGDRVELRYVRPWSDEQPGEVSSGAIEAADPQRVAIAAGSSSGATTRLAVAFGAGEPAREIHVVEVTLTPMGLGRWQKQRLHGRSRSTGRWSLAPSRCMRRRASPVPIRTCSPAAI